MAKHYKLTTPHRDGRCIILPDSQVVKANQHAHVREDILEHPGVLQAIKNGDLEVEGEVTPVKVTEVKAKDKDPEAPAPVEAPAPAPVKTPRKKKAEEQGYSVSSTGVEETGGVTPDKDESPTTLSS